MHVLRQRVITALILLPLVIGAIVFGPHWLVMALLGAGMLAAAFEWARLAGIRHRVWTLAYAALPGIIALAVWFWGSRTSGLYAVFCAALAWWLLALVLIVRHPRLPPWFVALAGVLTIAAAWLAAAHLYYSSEDGPRRLLFLLALVWAADIGAYFAGRLWGRYKLAPAVSPGKTWEGVLGGLLFSGAAAYGGALWFGLPPAVFILLCLAVAALSVVGDLTESLFKRQAGLKDSGSLLPGHGGILDRLDSFLAAAPAFALALIWLEKAA